MFLTIDVDASPKESIESSKDTIRTLPAGSYICRKIAVHMTGSVQEEMKEVLRSDSFCIIETDTSSSQNKKNGYPYELQYLASGTD